MTSYKGLPCCTCQAEWLPVFEAAAAKQGFTNLHIYQLIGGASQSAGTHFTGGAQDYEQQDNALILLADQMGAPGWPRYISQGFTVNHFHSVLRGCTHAATAAKAQVTSATNGHNGLANNGPDYGPAAGHRSTRTWQQGIAWAKSTILKETPVLTLVDASTNRPTPAAVKAAGHDGIIGYVSDYPVKNITKAECAAFVAAGLSVSLVWENGSQDAYGGFAAGVAAGQKAVAQAQALGCPKGVVIFAASDSNAATATTVGPYFQGWAQTVKAAGFLDGAYGDAAASHLCTYSWRVETWGSGDANLIQMVNTPIGPMSGTDTDEILHDFPRWSAAFIARQAANVAPAAITQAMRELVMEIHNTPASDEWGRRARIAYNLLRGLPGAKCGHAITAEPAHITSARTDLKGYIPGTNPADQWGKRARLAYNALRGIN